MGSLTPETPKQGARETTPIEKSATKLLNTLRSRRWVQEKSDLSRWIGCLLNLSKQYGEETVIASTKWYISNLDKESVRIRSPQGFKACFNQIYRAYEKAPRKVVKEVPEAKLVIKRLQNLTWPPVAEQMLLEVVQISMEKYTLFSLQWNNLEEWLVANNNIPKYNLLRFFMRYTRVSGGLGKGAAGFVERWMRIIHERIKNWRDWSGDLRKYVFDMDNSIFQKMGMEIAFDYTRSAKPWHDLMEVYHEWRKSYVHAKTAELPLVGYNTRLEAEAVQKVLEWRYGEGKVVIIPEFCLEANETYYMLRLKYDRHLA